MLLLDTDILIDIQRGHTPALDWFASLTEIPYVPRFVVMELVQDAKNVQQVRQAMKLIAPLTIGKLRSNAGRLGSLNVSVDA